MGSCGVVMWNENGVWQDLAGLEPQLACEAFELQLMHNCIETDLQSHKDYAMLFKGLGSVRFYFLRSEYSVRAH